MTEEWQFPDPPNTVAFLSDAVSSGRETITYVSHDEEDGAWQFHADSMSDNLPLVLICLHHPIDKDPTLAELADLPLGWCAQRDAVGQPWRRFAIEEEAEEA